MKPTISRRAPLAGDGAPKSHWLTPPLEAWTQPLFVEWELTGESWTDLHAHDEFAYVLEGMLFVEADGVTVEASAGDLVLVFAGSIGRYWAPHYARILGVYGPNPSGAPASRSEYRKLERG